MKDQKELWIPPLPIANEGLMHIPAPIIPDPDDSHTGRPEDLHERPVQDADDL